MKIKLKNIGALKQAEIDLSKDLIILAGPNNTGKTYAAYTVYGVCDLLRNIGSHLFKNHRVQEIINIYDSKLKNRSDNIQISDFLEDLLSALSSIINQKREYQLGNIFATDITYFADSEIDLILDKTSLINYMVAREMGKENLLGNGKEDFELYKAEGEKFLLMYRNPETNIEKYLGANGLMLNVINYVFQEVARFYFNNIYINIAERSAINIFSKELSIKRNAIVDQLLEIRESKNGDANQLLNKLQRYSLPIRDSLEIAEDLANISRNKSEYAFLADRMEEVLLDGKINISKYGEVQFSPNKSKVKNLSMNLSGSIVKSLSSLVIYFRHLAKKGDFIIIDEPELNLHPDNQRKIARLIGEFINHGFKVMISTHSDYIIRELNNLIMLKSGGEKANNLIEKYVYEGKQLIDHQRVGAYLFKSNRNYDIAVTETGFEVDTIDEEINNLNNASEEIYFTLFD